MHVKPVAHDELAAGVDVELIAVGLARAAQTAADPFAAAAFVCFGAG